MLCRLDLIESSQLPCKLNIPPLFYRKRLREKEKKKKKKETEDLREVKIFAQSNMAQPWQREIESRSI